MPGAPTRRRSTTGCLRATASRAANRSRSPARVPTGASDRRRVSERHATAATSTTGGGNTGTLPDGTVVYLKKSLQVLLDDLQNGIVDPPPPCIRRDFANAKRPDRMFVRAHVRNDLAPGSNLFCSYAPLNDEPQCVYRQAFSNPVWVNVVPCSSAIACNGTVGQLPTEATTTTGGSSGGGSGGSSGGGGTTGPIGGTYQPPVNGGVLTTSPGSAPPATGTSSMLLMQPLRRCRSRAERALSEPGRPRGDSCSARFSFS